MRYFDTCKLICLFLCYAQLSKLATQSKVCSAQPSPSLYQHSGQEQKNMFVRILVQTKTSLRPFQILPTFIDNITRYPLSGSVLFRQKSPIALRHFTDSVIPLPLEFGFRADFVQRRKSSFLRLKEILGCLSFSLSLPSVVLTDRERTVHFEQIAFLYYS